MFSLFSATSINRKQFWLSYLSALPLYYVALVAIDFLIHGVDPLVHTIAALAIMTVQFRLIYLRAVDVGYARPGWMTAGVAIPIVGIAILLSIGCRSTGSELGSQAPSLAHIA
jgi:hypothetical protein